MLAGALLHLAACLALVLATGPAGFVLAYVLWGLGRALESGPVEAWYVDATHRIEPGADVARGLGWQGAADGGGLAVGAVLGGLLPSVLAADGTDALVMPVLVAAALDVAYVVAILRLVVEDRPPRAGSARTALLSGLRDVPETVSGALRLSWTDPQLRLVLLLTALGGTAIAGMELLGPVRFAELAGSAEGGAARYGVVLAVSFAAAAAVGAVLALLCLRLPASSRDAALAPAVSGSEPGPGPAD